MKQTIAQRIYRLTGKTNMTEALVFIKNEPFLVRVFMRDFADPGDTIDYWIYIHNECMTDEQKEEADRLLLAKCEES